MFYQAVFAADFCTFRFIGIVQEQVKPHFEVMGGRQEVTLASTSGTVLSCFDVSSTCLRLRHNHHLLFSFPPFHSILISYVHHRGARQESDPPYSFNAVTGWHSCAACEVCTAGIGIILGDFAQVSVSSSSFHEMDAAFEVYEDRKVKPSPSPSSAHLSQDCFLSARQVSVSRGVQEMLVNDTEFQEYEWLSDCQLWHSDDRPSRLEEQDCNVRV